MYRTSSFLLVLLVLAVPRPAHAQQMMVSEELHIVNQTGLGILIQLYDENGQHLRDDRDGLICPGFVPFGETYYLDMGSFSAHPDCMYNITDSRPISHYNDEFITVVIGIPGPDKGEGDHGSTMAPIATYVYRNCPPGIGIPPDDNPCDLSIPNTFYFPRDIPTSNSMDAYICVTNDGVFSSLSGCDSGIVFFEDYLGERFVYPYDYYEFCPDAPGCNPGDFHDVFLARVDAPATLDNRSFEFSSVGNTVIKADWETSWDFHSQFPGGATVRIGSGRSLIVEGQLDMTAVEILGGGVRYELGSSGALTDVLIDPTVSEATLVSTANDGEVQQEVVTEISSATTEPPPTFSLHQNHPNPVVADTEIGFALPRDSPVLLAVYDVLGREVARLIEGEMEAGYHRAVFDASGLSAGVYVYRFEAGAYVESRRMLVAK